MKLKNYRSESGFTLIELMVVVILIGVIFGTVITATNGFNRRGRDGTRQNDLQDIQSGIQEYYADNHFYPEAAVINPLLSAGGVFTDNGKTYISKVPVDPGGRSYCYRSQIALSNSGICSNVVNSTTKCQFYQLCANLEDSIAGATPCTCGSNSYNFSVHSP
jgi:general secretion pathway protein G